MYRERKMKSQRLGRNISEVEVQDISKHGIWLYVKGAEYFLSFKDYPWFKDAKVPEIYNVELHNGVHLYWRDLDVDLEIELLKHPERYPLIFK